MSDEICTEIKAAAKALCHYPSGPHAANSCCSGIGRCEMGAAIEEITRLRAELATARDALQARVEELERLGKAIETERNQLIGVLQLAVEQSGETGENEPAWIGPACRILNAGFTKSAAAIRTTAGKGKP